MGNRFSLHRGVLSDVDFLEILILGFEQRLGARAITTIAFCLERRCVYRDYLRFRSTLVS